jgi:trehalose/maltose hydrolase-like predicted phosphorylase
MIGGGRRRLIVIAAVVAALGLLAAGVAVLLLPGTPTAFPPASTPVTALLGFLRRLGYDVEPAQIAATVDFYLARTAHGSTLSRVTHASVLAQHNPERAWATFREALDTDLDDTQGGTTRAGIHLGAMAGSIDVVQRSFAGLRITRDALDFTPRLPAELSRVEFQVRYRDQLLAVHLGPDRLRVSAAPGDAAPVLVRVGGEKVLLRAGQEHEFRRDAATPG